MVTSNDTFQWFEAELSRIKSNRFHILTPLSSVDMDYQTDRGIVKLAGDYARFLSRFGYARLFTDYRDAPLVSVYPLKAMRRHICKDGKSYIGFGDRGQQHVGFDEEAVLGGHPSCVYLLSGVKATELHPGFSEWLIAAYQWAKSKFSVRQWKGIVEGPQPFSLEELRVVEARRLFRWRFVGFAEDGDALFEVRNDSPMTLPFLTIGIRDSGLQILDGGVWLDVGHIEPGQQAIVKKDCYKDQIPSKQLEPFELPDPIPEKKPAYWEFGIPK